MSVSRAPLDEGRDVRETARLLKVSATTADSHRQQAEDWVGQRVSGIGGHTGEDAHAMVLTPVQTTSAVHSQAAVRPTVAL